ncbi:hypothetical protein JOM56_001677 [Amanita muscaria]
MVEEEQGVIECATYGEHSCPMTFPRAIEFSFNPGPWNIKEHLLVYIVYVAVGSPSAINVIVKRRLFNTNGKPVFRARAVPASVLNFDI